MRTFLFILPILILFSCGKENKEIQITRDLEAFSYVHLNSSFNVILVEDTAYFVELSGKAKIVNAVELTIENGILNIERTSSNDWLSPKSNKVTLTIHAPPLEGVNANETCGITTRNPITSNEFGLVLKGKGSEASLDLDCHTFFFWNNAPTGGRITLTGQCYAMKLWTTALVKVDASDVQAEYGILENESKADCSIRAITLFEYSIKDEGDVHIYGSPTQTNLIDHSGSGELITH